MSASPAARGYLSVLALLVLAGCPDALPSGPQPLVVMPASSPVGASVKVAIFGEQFAPDVTVSYADSRRSAVSAQFTGELGGLSLQDVQYVSASELSGWVPAGLAPGTYDLTVVDPAGRVGVLNGAFTVLQPEQTDGGPVDGGPVVDAGPPPLVALSWQAIGATQRVDVPFDVTVRALDGSGQQDTSFAGAVQLGTSAAANLRCVQGCAGATTVTVAFVQGSWTGRVAVGVPAVSALRLTATAGAVSASSNPFDVALPVRSAPRAAFTTNPSVVVVGQPVTFDASASSDLQTPSSALEVSWDFPGTAPGLPPWTAFTTTRTATFTFTTAGKYDVRLAVRDADGDLGYATLPVWVIAAAAELCVVTTGVDTDDGATSCSAPGPDGLLSIDEAVRILRPVTAGAITFNGPLSLVGDDLTVDAPVVIVGLPGVVLRRFLVVRADVTLGRLELTAQSSPTRISAGSLLLEDCYVHDAHGFSTQRPLTIVRSRFERCDGDCVQVLADPAGRVAARFSEFKDSPGHALRATGCQAARVIDATSNVFVRVGTAVRYTATALNCPTDVRAVHNTFTGGGLGLHFEGGQSHDVRNNLFTGHSVEAVRCDSGTFTFRSHHLLDRNASNGCAGTDGNVLSADPGYLLPSADDFRLTPLSPAVDSAVELLIDVNGPAPGSFGGAAPDRGGLEL